TGSNLEGGAERARPRTARTQLRGAAGQNRPLPISPVDPPLSPLRWPLPPFALRRPPRLFSPPLRPIAAMWLRSPLTASPPLRPATRASSDVNSWAVPFS